MVYGTDSPPGGSVLAKREPSARLFVLGRCRLERADGLDVTPKGAKSRAMLAYLALSPKGCADRAKVADLLWSERADPKASLRQVLKETRRLLAKSGLNILFAARQSLCLDLRTVWVDALEAERLARRADPDELEDLASIYVGDLLDDLPIVDAAFDEWRTIEQTRRRDAVCRALDQALRAGQRNRSADWIIKIARVLLEIDPTREEAHRVLMRTFAEQGDFPAAVRQYERCRKALSLALDVAPAPETKTILRKVRHGEITSRPSHNSHSRVVSTPSSGGSASVVVGEFKVDTKDAGQGHLSLALEERLRVALSKFRWLSVIDAGVEPAEPELVDDTVRPPSSVRPHYVVKGSIARSNGQIRTIAKLNHYQTGRIAWAQHFDRRIGESFDLVEDLAAAIAAGLDREILLAEITKARGKPEEALTAHDCVMRAIALIGKLTRGSFREADHLLRKAQEMDPLGSSAFAWQAFWYILLIGQGWASDIREAAERTIEASRRAIELDPQCSVALAIAGHVEAFVHHDYEQALSHFDRCLTLNPLCRLGWVMSAPTQCYLGNSKEALRRLQRYESVWHLDLNLFFFGTAHCIAHTLAGDDTQAMRIGRRTVRAFPHFSATYRPFIASLGHAGHVEEAQTHLATLRQMEPDFSIDWFRKHYPPLKSEDQARYVDGLRRAGVPES